MRQVGRNNHSTIRTKTLFTSVTFAKNFFASIELIPIGLPAFADGPCDTLLNDINVTKAKPDNAIDAVVSLEGKLS